MHTNAKGIESASVKSWRTSAMVWAGLSLLVGLAYGNSFQSGFVLDNEFIIRDDYRLREFSWANIELIFTKDYWYPKGVGGLFRPITTLTFLFEYSICGFADNPTHYHWINIGLHLLNSYLVYCLMTRLSKRSWIAIVAACFFAVHPITTESVTNLVGRADLLATASVLSGLLFYIQSTEAPANRRWIWLVGMAVTTVLGVLSKESAVVIVGLVPLYDAVIRLRNVPSQQTSLFSWFGSRFIGAYVIFVPIVIGLFVIRYILLHEHGPSTRAWGDNPLRATDFLSARLTALKVIVYYLGLLVFPLRLCCDYTLNAIPNSSWRMTSWEDAKAIASIALLVLLASIAWTRYRKGMRAEVFFIIWFFVTLLPTSNLLFLIDCNMAERFMYLPLVGFVGFLAMLLDAWSERPPRMVVMISIGVMIGLLSFRTFVRNLDWRSNLTLWTSAVEVCPESFRVQRSLAVAMHQNESKNPDFAKLVPVAQRAAQIARLLPMEQGDEKSHLMLGMLYGMQAEQLTTRDADGQIVLNEEARRLFELSAAELEYAAEIGETQSVIQLKELVDLGWDAIEIGPVGPRQVYENLWVTYSRLGRRTEAVDILRKIQRLNPLSTVVYHSLPDELGLSGNDREAGRVLMQAMILGLQSEKAPSQLSLVYNQINTHSIPAFVQEGEHSIWNVNNPLVREDVNHAIVHLIELFLRKRNFAVAEQLREQSKSFPCDSAQIDALFKELGGKKR